MTLVWIVASLAGFTGLTIGVAVVGLCRCSVEPEKGIDVDKLSPAQRAALFD